VESNLEENILFCSAVFIGTSVPDLTVAPVLFNFFPDGASVKHGIHYQQLTRDKDYFRLGLTFYFLWCCHICPCSLRIDFSTPTSTSTIALVSDRNRNSHFRPKPNIRQQKTTEYSVSAEYSALFCTFGRNSAVYYVRNSANWNNQCKI
jgi:hypothetical protein